MSKTLDEYEGQKSTSISTARRLAEFLGDAMVKNKGLSCRFIVSAKPHGSPVSERAVPVAIFTAEDSVKKNFLRRWLRDKSLEDFDLRSILDWGYYIERFGGVIQKLITIPAALQKVPNPVPRIRHPDWLFKRVAQSEDKWRQHNLRDMFARQKQQALEVRPGPDRTDVRETDPVVETPKPDVPIPDPRIDYKSWVAYMRPIWKTLRKQLKADASSSTYSRTQSSGVQNMFAQHHQGLSTRRWDILQITPTTTPGELRIWVSIGSVYQSFKIFIDKTFYLNCRKVPTFGNFYEAKKVSRILPGDQPVHHLYRVSVAETVFNQNESHFSSLIDHPDIEGVFEMEVSSFMMLKDFVDISIDSSRHACHNEAR